MYENTYFYKLLLRYKYRYIGEYFGDNKIKLKIFLF